MALSPLAGKPAPKELLIDPAQLDREYYSHRPEGEHYRELTAQFGTPYTRIDAPVTPEQKTRLANLSAQSVRAASLAGEPITAKLTRAPANDAPIGASRS